jgi:adenylyltransferase/sulfurtransferase
MDSVQQRAEALRRQITETESELAFLRLQLSDIEGKLSAKEATDPCAVSEEDDLVTHGRWPLSLEEYKRYGRQMIVPDIGIQGCSSPFISLGNICLT